MSQGLSQWILVLCGWVLEGGGVAFSDDLSQCLLVLCTIAVFGGVYCVSVLRVEPTHISGSASGHIPGVKQRQVRVVCILPLKTENSVKVIFYPVLPGILKSFARPAIRWKSY